MGLVLVLVLFVRLFGLCFFGFVEEDGGGRERVYKTVILLFVLDGWGVGLVLVLVLFVRLFGLCLFGFVGFLFLLGSGMGCGL